MAESAVSETFAPGVNNQATSSTTFMHIPQNGCSDQTTIFSQPSVSYFLSFIFIF
jgi:ribosomal protein S27E